MNLKVIIFFALVAVAFATESSKRHPRSLVYTTRVGIAPTYYEATIPSYNYYRTRALNKYPPGVDPIKCPNYPYCGTDAGSLVVPPVVPVAPVAPATHIVHNSAVPITTVPLTTGYPSHYYVIRK